MFQDTNHADRGNGPQNCVATRADQRHQEIKFIQNREKKARQEAREEALEATKRTIVKFLQVRYGQVPAHLVTRLDGRTQKQLNEIIHTAVRFGGFARNRARTLVTVMAPPRPAAVLPRPRHQ